MKLSNLIKPTTKAKKITDRIITDFNYKLNAHIKGYKYAYNTALNGDRRKLYDYYKDSLLDTHLTAVIELRKDRVLSVPFSLYDENGKKIEKSIINSKWFYNFIYYALDKLYFGFSLIQLDGIKDDNIISVSQVPFNRVDIETGSVYKDQYSNEKISYITPSYYKWLIEVVDDRKNLGLLKSVVPLIIWKKTSFSAWSEFAEIFGMPIRIGRTTTIDPKHRNLFQQFLANLNKSAWAMLEETDTIEFVERQHSDAHQVYSQLIDKINKEISKLILGSTEVIDSSNSSGYAQSLVHDNQFSLKIKKDIRSLEFLINNDLLPKLNEFGLIPSNLTFKFDISENLSLTQQIDIDTKLNSIYPIDKDYLSNKYKVKFAND